MAVYSKPNTGTDIINGLATVMTGAGIPSNYDDLSRTDHVVDSGNNVQINNIDGRFLVDRALNYRALPVSTGDRAEATGANAVVWLGGQSTRRHSLTDVSYSYDNTPASGVYLQIESPSGQVLFKEKVSQGPNQFEFKKGVKGARGKELIVTLLSGGSGVTGELNITGRRME